jgi:transcriptional regulator with XRE-family HTH domain
MNPGARIYQQQRRRHLSQQALVEALGTLAHRISRREPGQADPHASSVNLQANAIWSQFFRSLSAGLLPEFASSLDTGWSDHLQRSHMIDLCCNRCPGKPGNRQPEVPAFPTSWNISARRPLCREELLHAWYRRLAARHLLVFNQSEGSGNTRLRSTQSYRSRRDAHHVFWSRAILSERLLARPTTPAAAERASSSLSTFLSAYDEIAFNRKKTRKKRGQIDAIPINDLLL